MDTHQQRVATIGLAALEPYGFALAGGYALQAHGLVTRPSDDIDLFTDQWTPTASPRRSKQRPPPRRPTACT